MSNASTKQKWNVVCHLAYNADASLSVINREGLDTSVVNIATAAASGKDDAYRPIFIGLSEDHSVLLVDPQSKSITAEETMPIDAIPAYTYRDEENSCIWFMNDGDKEGGNDTLNCGSTGSSVMVIEAGAHPKHLKTICVGRGHHVTTFVGSSAAHPDIPRRAFVSNLMDGTLSVINNDPSDRDNYLQVCGEINLCEADKETGKSDCIPNNAFPHGMVFSSVTGKLYCLNNGYNTIAVVDPITLAIEQRVALPASSNLLLSPNGRFIIGKGADRKSNADHVVGKLSVLDLNTHSVVTTTDLQDIYPSTYRFSPNGKRLFVTTAATGKGAQRENLNTQQILVYNTSALPELTLEKEVLVGNAECSRRPLAYSATGESIDYLFIPNPSDGTLSLLDGDSLDVIDTVTIAPPNSKELLFSFWDGSVEGC